jgi:hypothetical protein
VLEFVAGKQLGLAELAVVTRYTEREHTRFEHQWEIKKQRSASCPGVARRRKYPIPCGKPLSAPTVPLGTRSVAAARDGLVAGVIWWVAGP